MQPIAVGRSSRNPMNVDRLFGLGQNLADRHFRTCAILNRLFDGDHRGKLVLRVDPDA